MKTIEQIKEVLKDIENRIEQLEDEPQDLLTSDSLKQLKTSRDALKWVIEDENSGKDRQKSA